MNDATTAGFFVLDAAPFERAAGRVRRGAPIPHAPVIAAAQAQIDFGTVFLTAFDALRRAGDDERAALLRFLAERAASLYESACAAEHGSPEALDGLGAAWRALRDRLGSAADSPTTFGALELQRARRRWTALIDEAQTFQRSVSGNA